MAPTKAYRKQFDFTDTPGRAEKYLLFIKQKFLCGNPHFYVVASRKRVMTEDGIMYALRIVQEPENPELEPIAECWINGHLYYLWRDHCWAIAQNKHGKELLQMQVTPTGWYVPTSADYTANYLSNQPCNKIVIVHRIGNDKLEEPHG